MCDNELNESTDNEGTIDSADVIKPINTDTIHRICSGQVVLTLAIAVKELVENAIDAGAKNIEIKLKNYGLDSVEVIDNGSGVKQENFEALTLKHYTSKIRSFNDLESVHTLGFRGEALSSLCALSTVTVTTRHDNSEYGTKLCYDNNGKVVSQTPTARSVGTTVTLASLFSPLPVRRKEFTKNHKREFNKMCNLLYAYCLVCTGVKFTCSNQVPSGQTSTLISTQGSSSVRENIVNIFGSKQISTLIEVTLSQPNEAIVKEYDLKLSPADADEFELDFFISSVLQGNGRSSSDRQFYFINSRPCEPTKLSKLVNEIYRQYNNKQYPFVYLNVKIKNSVVDVNVTPDKRQIFLEKEKLLMATVKMSLLEAFKNFPSTMRMQNLDVSTLANTSLKRNLEKSPKLTSYLDSFRSKKQKTDNDVSISEEKTDCKIKLMPVSTPKHNIDCTSVNDITKFINIKSISAEDVNGTVTDDVVMNQLEPTNAGDDKVAPEVVKESVNEDFKLVLQQVAKIKNKTDFLSQFVCKDAVKNGIDIKHDNEIQDDNEIKPNNDNKDSLIQAVKPIVTETPTEPTKQEGIIKKPKVNDKQQINSGLYRKNRRYITQDITMDDIKASIEELSANKDEEKKEVEIRFRSQIAPDTNKTAEEELEKQFEKSTFSKMKIIGQFNYGFIIAALDDDLFIVDQHATDEKYNFEDLRRNTVLESQPLVSAKPLQLSASSEITLIDNEDVFRKNGFHFTIDEDAEPTKKVMMTKIPMSKSYIFGRDDIDEMLHMLQEGCNDGNCRPSRIRGMFASRACRKSVMVGKALTKTVMRRLIDNMGEIEQPWNCPHGRPTMRHLINLALLLKDDD